MIILIALVGLDYTGVLHIPIFTMMATLSIQNWIDPLLTLYRSVYLLVLSLIFYAVAGWLYERRIIFHDYTCHIETDHKGHAL